jgi:hypothetical protein
MISIKKKLKLKWVTTIEENTIEKLYKEEEYSIEEIKNLTGLS